MHSNQLFHVAVVNSKFCGVSLGRSNPCGKLVRVEDTSQPINMNVAKGIKRGVNALVHIHELRDHQCLDTASRAFC